MKRALTDIARGWLVLAVAITVVQLAQHRIQVANQLVSALPLKAISVQVAEVESQVRNSVDSAAMHLASVSTNHH